MQTLLRSLLVSLPRASALGAQTDGSQCCATRSSVPDAPLPEAVDDAAYVRNLRRRVPSPIPPQGAIAISSGPA